ncbi:MAG: DUF928 domain-containing protein [bacterium]
MRNKKGRVIKILYFLSIGLIIATSSSMPASDKKENNINQPGHQSIGAPGVSAKKAEGAIPLMLSYRPPSRGRPANRVGGGTRGDKNNTPFLAALVPDHTGLTTQAKPLLYWFFSGAIKEEIEFTLIDERHIEPLLETNLDIPGREGIQCLSLTDYGINLSPSIPYQWFVAIISDPNHRSKDLVVCGSIKCIEPSQSLISKLSQSSRVEVPGIYAEEGLWYDALSTLNQLIAADPNDMGLQKQRIDLFEQVGLWEVAEYERKGDQAAKDSVTDGQGLGEYR